MRWTTERPQQHGWYWVRKHKNGVGDPEPAEVVLVSMRFRRAEVYYSGSDVDDSLDSDMFGTAEWCGPLEVPE
jgi:hypothetical protein